MIKKLILILGCLFVLTGCWNRRELNELGIVLAFALDQDGRTGEIILTSQLVRPGALKKEGGGGQSPVEIITTRGKTIFEAMTNITKQFDRKAYFSHAKLVIISEQLAREGLLSIIDVLVRSQEIRRLAWVMVAKGTQAQEILGVKKGIEIVQATYLINMIQSRIENSEVSAPNLLEIVKALSGKGIDPVTGVMELTEQPNFPAEGKEEKNTQGIKLSGTAVFSKDQLVGYLSDVETRGLNWVTGRVKRGVMQIAAPGDPERLVTIEIKRTSSKIRPEIINGAISFLITLKEEGNIAEQESMIDSSKLDTFEKIARAQQQVIKHEVRLAIDKAQKQFGADIFGFGGALNKAYPQEWKKINNNWPSIFPTVKYAVEADVKLSRSGLLLKPIKRAD